jgi:thiamine-phosphate pyrophosphorylase
VSVPRLYLVTDRRATGGRPLPDVVAAALDGVARAGLAPNRVAVQLREKDLDARELLELARQLRALTAPAGVALYVNDRVDVALAAGADGVHLGGGALSAADVARVAPALRIAVSTHGASDVRAARAAQQNGVSFAVCGPVLDTPAKRRFGPPLGYDAFAEAARVGLPLVAIGGIGPREVAAALRSGAAGVACIRAVMSAADPANAVSAFCQELK